MKQTEHASKTVFQIIDEAALSDGFIELFPRRSAQPPENTLTDEQKDEANQYLDLFFKRLSALLAYAPEVELSCYYSIHATIDQLCDRLLSDQHQKKDPSQAEDQPLTEEQLEYARWLMQEILCDRGFLHAQTRDSVQDTRAISFHRNVVNRALYYNTALLDTDRCIDYALSLNLTRTIGFARWTKTYARLCEFVETDGHVGVAHRDDSLVRPIYQLYLLAAEKLKKDKYKENRSQAVSELLNQLRNVLKAHLHSSEKRLLQYLKEDILGERTSVPLENSPFLNMNSVEGLLSFIAEIYCYARSCGKEAKRQLSKRTISDAQYQLYCQRDQVNFTHFLTARHWDDYQRERKDLTVDTKTDNSVYTETKHERQRKDPLVELGVTESSECLRRPLSQEDVARFSAIVEAYYANRRMIKKGQRYEKGKYFDVKLEKLLRLVLDTYTFEVTTADKNLYPAPVIVYAVLSSPKTLRNMSPELKTILGMSDNGPDGDSETQFLRKPIGEYSYDSKIRALQLAQTMFFFQLTDFFAQLLLPEYVDQDQWIADFIELTDYPPSVALVCNSAQTGGYEQILYRFYQNMIERFSKVEIRGPVLNKKIDYQKKFRESEKNSGKKIRKTIQNIISEKPEWVRKYRDLWSTPTHKQDYIVFLKCCDAGSDELQTLKKCVRLAKWPDEIPNYSRLKKEQFILCVLEDELRKRNILESVRKMDKITSCLIRKPQQPVSKDINATNQ